MSEDSKLEYIGVDISKSTLDICTSKEVISIKNTIPGILKFIEYIQKQGPCHIICENTGGYEGPLVNQLHKARIPITSINPRQIRDFAKSIGRLEKTDKIDAKIILTYGQKICPKPDKPLSPAETILNELVTARAQIIETRTLELAQVEHTTNELLLKHSKVRISLLEKQIKELDAQIASHIKSDSTLNSKASRLSAIKGVGPATTAAMIAFMPELGTISDKQAAKLAGVAPINHDSGKMRGQRHIRGGRPKVRKAIYMAALVASRFNPILKAFYAKLIERGKSPKLAITAIMRKLIILMNRLLKNPNFSLV